MAALLVRVALPGHSAGASESDVCEGLAQDIVVCVDFAPSILGNVHASM